MHQLLVRLRAERDCAWERRYHRKIRGRLAQALQDSAYDHLHDSQAAPFTFSDPMPYQPELAAGDDLHLLVAARDDGILKAIARSLQDDPELTAGAFVFDARAATPIPVDVGPPGETGTLTTSSGVLLTMTPTAETETSTPEYWTERKYDTAAFQASLTDSVQRLIDHETSLDPLAGNPFDDYTHRKTYAVDVEVTPGNDLTVIASKWDVGFEVRSEQHRRVLNALLGLGVGAKRSYGFGLLQVDTQSYDPTGGEQAAPEVA